MSIGDAHGIIGCSGSSSSTLRATFSVLAGTPDEHDVGICFRRCGNLIGTNVTESLDHVIRKLRLKGSSMLVHDDPKYQSGDPPTPDAQASDVIVSSDTRRANRIPSNQSRTRKWPVLHYGSVPHIDLAQWRFDVRGLVDCPLSFNWEEFQALPRVKVFSDFHCVTQWSRLGNLWEGVAVRELLDRAGVQPNSRFVIPTGYDRGWTTNLPLADFLVDDALLADTHDGDPIDADHGGPVRLIVPRLYAWKSAKWIKSIELTADDHPGYWEQAGYHHHGDPWTEERFG